MIIKGVCFSCVVEMLLALWLYFRNYVGRVMFGRYRHINAFRGLHLKISGIFRSNVMNSFS